MREGDCSNKKTLSPKEAQFLAELLKGNGISLAAKAVGIGEATAYRWLKEPNFSHLYREAKQRIFESVLSKFLLSIDSAHATLLAVMRNGEAPAGARVRACQIILELAIENHKIEELEARIAALEGKSL